MERRDLKKLPIGIQTFAKIREENMLYIDKTEYLCKIADGYAYCFLSRPRRFGKSLMLSTLKSMFEGRKDLFTGLYAENNWDWEKTSPVVRFAFNELDYHTLGLEAVLKIAVGEQAAIHDIKLDTPSASMQFRELIHKLYNKKGKVVLLIDEYDKPLIDFLTKDKIHIAKENQNILRSFYGIIKEADPYLRFAMLTGISKFSQTSIFSQLNNLRDISLEKKYGAMLGYTNEELRHYFTVYLHHILPELELSESEAWEQIKDWYNGYTWNFKEYVYNPFSILQFFEKGSFENFWFQSGAPKFLIDLLKEKSVFKIENTVAGFDSLNTYDIENIEPIVLLFQTGYISLKSKDGHGLVVLDYPNREVRNSLYQYILSGFSGNDNTNSLPTVINMRTAFLQKNPDAVATVLKSLFASMPYDLMPGKLEVHFQAVVYIAFRYLGVFIETEVKYAKGRADAVVHTPDRIWILEFKIDQSAEVALQQIKDKDYAAAYRASSKEIYGVGISLSTETRQMEGFVSVEL